MSKAAFLDRDGVINRKAPAGGYITLWENMEILPGAPEAISLLHNCGFSVVVITNQRCVAKGLISIEELHALHRRMCDVLATDGGIIDAVYYCPHDVDPPCACRKPNPGLILEAARIHELDLAASWMIGDSVSDIEAGRRAGCRTAQIVADHELSDTKADVIACSLLDAVRKINLQIADMPAVNLGRGARFRS